MCNYLLFVSLSDERTIYNLFIYFYVDTFDNLGLYEKCHYSLQMCLPQSQIFLRWDKGGGGFSYEQCFNVLLYHKYLMDTKIGYLICSFNNWEAVTFWWKLSYKKFHLFFLPYVEQIFMHDMYIYQAYSTLVYIWNTLIK